ncbi:CapA family protein [Gordonia sp. (in: high G+C Gram-positive bacteria)]|uniref:CapA family protein n=1 Tax=Gordonia sp. (in: high G+C Gram-positive bacteria) TaxID=84139 RepID=UPI003C73B943
MRLDPTGIAGIRDLTAEVRRRVARDPEAVAATLRRAARGELPLEPSLTAAEADYLRNMLGVIAEAGPLSFIESNDSGRSAVFDDEPLADADWDPMVVASSDVGSALNPREIPEHLRARLGVLLLSYLCYDDFRLPHTGTGGHRDCDDILERTKAVYRMWFNQLTVAEPGSGLEQYFADQRLDFPTVDVADRPSLSLSCAGDLLAVDVLVPESTTHLFDGIADFYSTADIVSANLESVVDSTQLIGRYESVGRAARMNTSPEMVERFVEGGGITFVSTATDHAMDWGEHGVLATLDVLRDAGLAHAGTAATACEQDRVVLSEHDGIKVALLAFTFGVNDNAVPDDKPYLVDVVRFNDVDPALDLALVRRQVEAARAAGADYIIAYCHWGWEFETYPHQVTVDAAHAVIDCGVDTIIGNHAHVAQPMERVVREGRPDGLIVYALGGFVSYHPESRNSALALTVRFDLVRHDDGGDSGDGTVYLANLRVLPIYLHHTELPGGDFDSRILRFADVCEDPDRFGLTEAEQTHLPYLKDELLRGRVLPAVVPEGLLAR